MLPRRAFLVLACLTCLAAAPAPKAGTLDPAKGKAEGDVVWYDARTIGIEGRGWAEAKAPFDRLPAKAEKIVRKPVWDLSRQSAGLCVRFRSDATTIHGDTSSPKTVMMLNPDSRFWFCHQCCGSPSVVMA